MTGRLIFSLAAVLCVSACSPAIHQAVEAMQPDERSVWISKQSSESLCSGYQKPWAKPETKLMIEAELASRGRTTCGTTKIGQASVSLYRGSKYANNRVNSGKRNSLVNDRDCADFSSGAQAQRFFLASGGPTRDPHDLDRDGDGLACEWGTEAKRLVRNGSSRNIFATSRRRYSSSKCYVGPRGGTYTITSSGNKNYSGC